MQPPSQCYKCIQGSQLVPWSSTEALKEFPASCGLCWQSRQDTHSRKEQLCPRGMHPWLPGHGAAACQEDGGLGSNAGEAWNALCKAQLNQAPRTRQVPSYYSSGFLPLLLQYLLYASWNMFLQGILAFSLVQMRKEPPIFRWRE